MAKKDLRKPEGGANLTPAKEKQKTATIIALWNTDSVPQAAKALGISRQAIYDRIKNWGIAEVMEEMQEAGRLTLLQGTQKAAGNLVDKVTSKDEKISLQASTEILDRSGLTKPTGGGGLSLSFHQHLAESKGEYRLEVDEEL